MQLAKPDNLQACGIWRWHDTGFVKRLGLVLPGTNGELDYSGRPIVGDTLMLLLNAHQ